MSEKIGYNPETEKKNNNEPKKISRRDFLKGATATLLGLSFPFLKGHKKTSQNYSKKPEELKKENKPVEEPKETKETPEQKIEKLTNKKINEQIENILKVNNFDDLVTICKKIESYSETINKYAKKYNINPEYLFGLIFIESKGDSLSYNSSTDAKGLCQFTPETAKEFNLSDRENPHESINATSKFINYYQKFLGTEDLAVASFHMGYGNIFDLIQKYIDPEKIKKFPKEAVVAHKLNYPKIFFNTTKESKPKAYNFLFNTLEDDSANYYFKILAAANILKINKISPQNLKELSQKYFDQA